MAKQIVDFANGNTNLSTRHSLPVPVHEIADELGLSLPIFYSVFYPHLSGSFEKMLKALPGNIVVPTWSHGLLINTGNTKTRRCFSTDWNNHTVSIDMYREIKRRWELFDTVKKKEILKYNKTILEIFPKTIKMRLSKEKRIRLSAYVGMRLEFYGDVIYIKKIDRVVNSNLDKDTAYHIKLRDIRDDLVPTDKNIYADHVFIRETSLEHVALFRPRFRDTIKFAADVIRYRGSIDRRYGLKHMRILKIWRGDNV